MFASLWQCLLLESKLVKNIFSEILTLATIEKKIKSKSNQKYDYAVRMRSVLVR